MQGHREGRSDEAIPSFHRDFAGACCLWIKQLSSSSRATRSDPDEAAAAIPKSGLFRVARNDEESEVFPWDARRTLYWRTVFPQMTNWLPDDEAAQLRSAFEVEIRRLDAA